MRLGKGGGAAAALLVESPIKKAFLSTLQADLSCTPFLMRRYA